MTDIRLTPAQAADYLGISLQAIYVLNSRPNDFPVPTYTGRTPTWTRSALAMWRTAHPSKQRRQAASSPGPMEERPTTRFHSLQARLAFATDGCRTVLTETLLRASEQAVRTAASEAGAEVTEFAGAADHIHLVVTYPADQSIAQLAKRFRHAAARAVRQQTSPTPAAERIRVWSSSYYASSAVLRSVAAVAEYVRQQAQDVNN
ncbi:IS200/IS605 family transposase [Streptomyces sp. NPDC002676]